MARAGKVNNAGGYKFRQNKGEKTAQQHEPRRLRFCSWPEWIQWRDI